MPVTAKIIFIIACMVLPALGLSYMMIVERNVKIFLKNKVINKGIYKNKPVYGDDVVPIARSFKRVARILFTFSVVISLLLCFLLYLNW
jgi:hypothetical protein